MEWVIGLVVYCVAVTFIISFMMGASRKDREYHDGKL